MTTDVSKLQADLNHMEMIVAILEPQLEDAKKENAVLKEENEKWRQEAMRYNNLRKYFKYTIPSKIEAINRNQEECKKEIERLHSKGSNSNIRCSIIRWYVDERTFLSGQWHVWHILEEIFRNQEEEED